jgi:hypothetical protein
MKAKTPKNTCIVCDRGADEVPLLSFEFRKTSLRICPQHLPTLIHNPAQLADRMPGAEGLSPSEHKD